MAYQSELMKSLLSSTPSSVSTNSPMLMLVEPDTEPVIQINADARTITVPPELLNIGVAGDHKSETIYFNVSRYFDGADLSEHNCLIRYINAGNEYGEFSVTEMVIGTDTIKLGWTIDNYVTRYSGTVNFTVQFETVNNGVKYQWQTTPAQLNVMAGLNIEQTITEKDDVLFRTLSNQVQDLQRAVEELQHKTEIAGDLQDQINILNERVTYLEENVVYALTEV